MNRPVVVILALDGVEPGWLQAAAAAGELPNLAPAVLGSAPVALDPLGSAGSDSGPEGGAGADDAAGHAFWASLACGVGPAGHGIAGRHVPDRDGVRLRRPRADDLCATPLWTWAVRAGARVGVVGWPATAGTVLPSVLDSGGGTMAAVHGADRDEASPAARAPVPALVVAEGFHACEGVSGPVWPLAADAVAPHGARALVRAARMHPLEVQPAMLDAVRPPVPLPPVRRADLDAASATLLAAWASVHNLGVHMALAWGAGQDPSPPAVAAAPPALLMLRLDGLARWLEAARAALAVGRGDGNAAAVVVDADLVRPWLRWLDLMWGRYRELLPTPERGAGAAWSLLVRHAGVPTRGSAFLEGGVAAVEALAGRRALEARAWWCLACAQLGITPGEAPDPCAALQGWRACAPDDAATLSWVLSQSGPGASADAVARQRQILQAWRAMALRRWGGPAGAAGVPTGRPSGALDDPSAAC